MWQVVHTHERKQRKMSGPSSAILTTTPPPAVSFSLTDINTWSWYHWAVGIEGAVILLLFMMFFYCWNRASSYAARMPTQGRMGEEEPLMMGRCPPERRMQMLSMRVTA